MGFYIGIFVIIFNAAWFWFCFVYVTQNHSFNWREMIIWIVLAGLIRVPIILFAASADDITIDILARVGSILLSYLFFYFLLGFRFNVERSSEKLKILVGHLVGVQLLGFALRSLN